MKLKFVIAPVKPHRDARPTGYRIHEYTPAGYFSWPDFFAKKESAMKHLESWATRNNEEFEVTYVNN